MKQIYENDFGMTFYWKRADEVVSNKVQLVFKEIGFHLTLGELEQFSTFILESESRINACSDCSFKKQCSRYLLQTPAQQIDLAVSISELKGIQDLVGGTVFKIKLREYVFGVGKN
jgi:hypothetical protein